MKKVRSRSGWLESRDPGLGERDRAVEERVDLAVREHAVLAFHVVRRRLLGDPERRHQRGAGQPGGEPVGRPELGFPRAFLESDDVRELIYGETWRRLRLA